ncbi:branched-chain amino acid transport system II carrier protein [Peptostreptococcus faecalis]|uniref:branched-chain amino acid transport system II carrier protein n=1 Tax=Peptostreptococcus faecalis TaxID=2045015 RepID=UPI000C7DC601|nr:branched-chain amino acid transport system II carrier protein [Peptostreptococcus faecalis]
MSIKFKDILVVGFALFAMFFGAGNLIFPPYLGVLAGTQWFSGFFAFLFADGGLALLGVIAMTKVEGDMPKLFTRAGKNIGVVIGTIMVLCIGPFVAIPRTSATTYEIGILPTIGDGFSPIIFSIIFFAIVLFLSIKPSKVVDIVGAVLTPALLICLAVLIIKGSVSPLGEVMDRTLIDNVFVRGISDGYQTMDAMAACIFAGIIITSIQQKGYSDKKAMTKATIMSGLVAFVGLALVYGGLAYLGATVSGTYDASVNRTDLIVDITSGILGGPGKVILAVIVGLACLTTAIGLVSSCSSYFNELSKGKLKYEINVAIVCVFSAFVSNFGVEQIIAIAGPLLGMVYPAVVVYIILGLFNNKISNNNIFRISIWVALILGILFSLSGVPGLTNIEALQNLTNSMNSWPGGQFGFFWIVPVIIAGIIGKFIPNKAKAI